MPKKLSELMADDRFLAYSPEEKQAKLSAWLANPNVQDDRLQTAPTRSRLDLISNPAPGAAPTTGSTSGARDFAFEGIKQLATGAGKSGLKTFTGLNRLAGIQPPPGMEESLEPASGVERAGGVLGDMAQLAIPEALIPRLAGGIAKARGLSKIPSAILDAIESGARAGIGSGTLTGVQTGDPEAAMSDARTGAMMGAGLSGLGSALVGGGRALAAAPFKATTPEARLALENEILPMVLGGRLLKPTSIEEIAAVTGPARAAAGSTLASEINASSRVPSQTYKGAMADARAKFAWPESATPPQDPRNPNFYRFPVSQDPAMQPQYRPSISALDEAIRDMVATKGNQPSLSPSNLFEQKKAFDAQAAPIYEAGTRIDSRPAQRVGAESASAVRDLLRSHEGGRLAPFFDEAQSRITTDDLVREALSRLQAGAGTGGVLTGGKFRRAIAGASALANPTPLTIGTSVAVGSPSTAGFITNRAGQLSRGLAKAPAVRGLQESRRKKN